MRSGEALAQLRYAELAASRRFCEDWDYAAGVVYDGVAGAVYGGLGSIHLREGEWGEFKDDEADTASALYRYQLQLKSWKDAGVYDGGTELIRVGAAR